MDPLLRGRDGHNLLRGHVRVRPGAARGRDDEPNARVSEAVRLDLQQQVVHGHVHHPLLEQEGPLRGEDQEEPTDHLLP